MSIPSSQPYRRRRRRRRFNYLCIIFWLVVLLAILGIVAGILHLSRMGGSDDPTEPTPPPTTATEETPPATDPTSEPTTAPTEPGVTKLSTATIAATGDVLMHLPCIEPAWNATAGRYDFSPYFAHLKDYLGAADYTVANLETTLAGLDNGYSYSGYPSFNCPDEIVSDLKAAGLDMLLTANNHSYDTRHVGFLRTQQAIEDNGLDYIGTVSNADDTNYLIKDINGIKIGMICYTYETEPDPNAVSLNGVPVKDEDKGLINTFSESDLPTFYAAMERNLSAMEAAGVEATVLYIHWGYEYNLAPSSAQKTIAQKMCDLGVDVIVGGHPHVVQPMELLSSTTDADHKTVCLYSTGNFLSNQRRDLMNLNTGHTEDGVLFSFSFAKYSDGTIRVEDVSYLPLWINLYRNTATGKNVYDILPLDKDIEDWKTQFDLTEVQLTLAEDSYDRTADLLSEGFAQIEAYLEALPTPE